MFRMHVIALYFVPYVLFSVLLMSITSKYFAHKNEHETHDLADNFICIEKYVASKLITLDYGPNVEYIYNPLNYASNLHNAFVKKFLNTKKKVLFLGINPGPWGMCQTGVNIKFIIHKS